MLQLNNEYNYSFKLYQTRQSLEQLSGEWHALIKRAASGTTPFQTPEWCLTWLEMNPDAKPCIVGIHENNRLIFLAPLMQRRMIFGARSLGFLSGPDCSYGNVICDADKDPQLLFADFITWLRDERICDLLLLDNIAENSPWIDGYDDKSVRSELKYSSLLVVNKSMKQDYFADLHKLIRRDVRHTTRQLEQMGELTISVVDCDQQWRDEVLPRLVSWKLSWLKSSGRWGGGMFNGQFMRFLTKLTMNCQSGSLVARSCVVALNGKPITANLVLIHNDTIYGYFSAFDPELNKVSLGTLRDIHLVKWMVNDNYTAFDMLGHPEAYKDRIANKQKLLVNLALALNWRGKFASIAVRLRLRDRFKQAFLRLPGQWRRAIIFLLRK